MTKRVAISMAHGHVARWLQTSVYSLKANPNEVKSDVFIAETWPGHPSLKAIKENDLGKGITFIPCTIRLYSHATGLDQILDMILERGDYDYMFCMETDCRAMKPGWLDWFVSFMKDDSIGMAGFFWHEGDRHYNINPSGTLYNLKVLAKYHKEVRENKENIFWHPRGNKHGNDAGMDPTIKDVAGVFSETRGIKFASDAQLDVILKGVPQAAWFEPGAYLYCKSIGEYGGVSVPCDHIYGTFGGRHQAPEGTYYGGVKDPWFIHYWGGTRCYDFLKHPVNDTFVRECAPDWMRREDYIWKQTVPERYHQIVYDIDKEIDVEGMMKKNLLGG